MVAERTAWARTSISEGEATRASILARLVAYRATGTWPLIKNLSADLGRHDTQILRHCRRLEREGHCAMRRALPSRTLLVELPGVGA